MLTDFLRDSEFRHLLTNFFMATLGNSEAIMYRYYRVKLINILKKYLNNYFYNQELLNGTQRMDKKIWQNLRVTTTSFFILIWKKYMLQLYMTIKNARIFEGHLPILITSDLDIIQEIFIKQSSNFSARKVDILVFIQNTNIL